MDVLKDGEIVLYGTVGEGFFEDGFTALNVVDALAEIGRNEDVTVRVNSGGGSVIEGMGIYSALDSHRGKVTVYVDGIAASAASFIAMAGDEIVMRNGASMMIHDPLMMTAGNSADHEKSIEALETLGNSLADIYAERTGKKPEEAREMMKAETWMSAAQAVKNGFADRVEKARAKEPTAFDYRIYQNAPSKMVAMANSRGWSMQDEAETAETSATNRQEEKTMTEKAKAEAEVKAAAAEETKAKTEAKTEATASVDVDKAVSEAREAAKAEAKQRAADIAITCELCGAADKAAGYIAGDMTHSEVLADLKNKKVSGAANISTTHQPGADASASWGGVIEKVNAKVKA